MGHRCFLNAICNQACRVLCGYPNGPVLGNVLTDASNWIGEEREKGEKLLTEY